MKFAIYSALALAICAQANAASGNSDVNDLARKAHVSNTCARKILDQATRECNAASMKIDGSDRMQECFYSPELSGMDKGVMGIIFTAGDADEYNYSVSISDESDAQDSTFVVRSQK